MLPIIFDSSISLEGYPKVPISTPNNDFSHVLCILTIKNSLNLEKKCDTSL